MTQAEYDLLIPLVERHIANHAGDPARSLAAVGSASSVRDFLRRAFTDVGVQTSLGYVGTALADKSDETRGDISIGSSTSTGERFRILRPLAKGGLGQVSVAMDTELPREVAVKQIQARYADLPDSRQRFMAEAEINGGLEHPGIVPVYGLGKYPDGRPFYAMRYIHGQS